MGENNNIEIVHANLLDDSRIYYRCKHCGKTHSHGNAQEYESYYHYRGSHCKHPKSSTDLKIIVDQNTTRNFKKNGTYARYTAGMRQTKKKPFLDK
jgi:hypothetical protein